MADNQIYTRVQRICHWTIVLYCLAALPTALAIRRVHMGHIFGIRGSIYDQIMARGHEWGGWVVLVLTLLFIGSRFWTGVPPLPDGMSGWQRAAARATHWAIYVGLSLLVFSGATAMYAGGKLSSLHVVLSRVGAGLIVVHVAAVGWHVLVRRDRLLSRMWS